MNHPIESTASVDQADVVHEHRLSAPCMHCGFEPPIEECLEFDYDMMKDLRRSSLIRSVNARRGTEALHGPERFSSGFIVEMAAHRYFMLLDAAQAELKGKFCEDDFQVILNAECGPTWEWDPMHSVAQMVADNFGVDSLDELPEESHMRQLLEKLLKLTSLESAALVDACERIWRGYANPML